mmetsp:Transcript_7787/g.7360  ORF Transcript_7787/g.7360 Transcript_7787/m.7360 type:complete len:366 (-) Transcript_7787:137-1234(-)
MIFKRKLFICLACIVGTFTAPLQSSAYTPSAPITSHSFVKSNVATVRGINVRSPSESSITSSLSVASSSTDSVETETAPWFSKDSVYNGGNSEEPVSLVQMKARILQLGAALDRGQAYNPTSGQYYSGTMLVAKRKIQELIDAGDPKVHIPKSLEDIEGEWELVLTTVKHGIFRSSPFFLAIQEAFGYAEDTEAFGADKANLFFKLHELQTCSWGASKVGRVAQRINPKSKYIYSEFDTSIFSLTVIPILGWFKLLPTFGGCVVTASKCQLEEGGKLEMEVDYTTSRPVPGLQGLGKWVWDVKVPVGFVWQILPWNNGRKATCSVDVKYFDDDFRIVQDNDGELFVYTRPVVPRPLDIEEDIKEE